MDESKRLITSWVRIKHWLSENFPETLENLYSPAFHSQIEAAESTIGLPFPEALKTLLLEHNGEDRHWPPGIFPGGHRFLPTEDIVETWYKLQEYNDATPENWLPISTSRSNSIRFLDFKPPQGGSVGQVAEVNFDKQSYAVLADSFVEYIEHYAMDLGVNKYAAIGDDILLHDELLNDDALGDVLQDNQLKNDSLGDVLLNDALLNENIFNDDELPDIELHDSDTPTDHLPNSPLVTSPLSNMNIAMDDLAYEESPALDQYDTQPRMVHPQSAAVAATPEFVERSPTPQSNELQTTYMDVQVSREAGRRERPTHMDTQVSRAPVTQQRPTQPDVQEQGSLDQPPSPPNELGKAQDRAQDKLQHDFRGNSPQAAQGVNDTNKAQSKQFATQTQVPTLESSVQPVAKKPVPLKAQATAKTPEKPMPPSVRKDSAFESSKSPVAQVKQKAQEAQQKPVHDRMESGERLIIVGEMKSLMGKEEMLFTVETEHAKEYTFLAKASFTKGFSEISLDQYVRILAKKFHGEIKSHFIEQGLASHPEYVAFDYVVLPVEKPSADKPSLPPPENLDEIAHRILQAIQTSFQRSSNYKDITPEQSSFLHSKFYNVNTEKLLKLGFHYTADLVDRVGDKSSPNTQPFIRVMSFFDDGIVATFYHIKPKFTWPFHTARKVIEFETELSDGNIIISTTADDEIEYPLPKTISRYIHPPGIPIEGLLHKHRAKIRRYQTRKPDAAIVKVRNKKEFVALRQRRRQLIYNHLKSIGWVTKEYVARQFNNKEVAEQVYARIKRFAGTKI